MKNNKLLFVAIQNLIGHKTKQNLTTKYNIFY
jgi:hypothetical protein